MALYLVLGLIQARRDAPSIDEGVNLAAGVSTVMRHDVRMNPEHPAPGRAWQDWPALFAHPIVPDSSAWERGDWPTFATNFISDNRDAGRLQDVLFLSRLVPLLDGVLIALVMHALARQLFGPDAGLLAAGLWLSTPVFVGFGHLGTTDLPFTLSVLLVCLALVRLAQGVPAIDERGSGGARSGATVPAIGGVVLVGLACGAAMVTRFSGIIVAPAAAIVAAVIVRAQRRNALGAAAAVMLIAWASVWVGIRALGPTTSGAPRQLQDRIIDRGIDHDLATHIVLTVPWPVEYRAGFAYLALTSNQRDSYLFGHYAEGSNHWFFAGSLVAKLPAGALLVAVLGPLGLVGVDPRRRREALLCVALPITAFTLSILLQPLNLGLRYVFPTVAGLFVLGSAAAAVAAQRLARPVVVALGAALLISQVVSTLDAHPHSLAWTPPPFRPAYRWVSDSNLDLGQDWFRVDDFVRRHPKPLVALVGSVGLSIPRGSRNLITVPPRQVRGWVAVSAFGLDQVYRRELAWLRAYCPVGDLGGTILLYRFDRPPSATAGPTQPVAECRGDQFSHRLA